MGPVLLAVAASLFVYIAAVTLIPSRVLQRSDNYTRHMINRLREESAAGQGVVLPAGAGLQEDPSDRALVRAFLLLPGMQRAVPAIQRAGLWRHLDKFVLGCLLTLLLLQLATMRFGLASLPVSFGVMCVLAALFVRHRISHNRRKFLDLFPDALDSLVRSVRSGYPLNAAIALVGDSVEAPVGPEFKRVADETAYGWTLFEALSRLADRIDEQDVRFFTIVLSVQQESGGNLSEVLSNLSSVLRKRKMLRLKIRALTSEGRATSWILGSLPFAAFGIIAYAAPDHLDPLLQTDMGNMILAGVFGMVGTGMVIVRQIINMDV